MRLRLGPSLVLLPALSLFVFGCSHKLDDPKPAVGSVMPNLVCNAQITTAVTVSGSGLTPVPTKTLHGGEVLAAPTVTLAMSTDLGGSPMSAQPVTLNDPTDTGNTHVRWESEQQMSFDVTPDQMLGAGVYDVTLTNPDGKAATLPQALAVVPPPSITAVMPMAICDEQGAQTITITGQDFLVVGGQAPEVDVFDANGMAVFTATAMATGCMDVAAQLNEAIQECTTLTFSVPTAALPVGSYTLSVTNPAPAACASTEKVAFTVEPPPELTGVLPTTICAGGGTLTLSGKNFAPTATASLTDSATGQTVDAASDLIAADGTQDVAHFLVSGGLTVGDKLDVSISNHDGCAATLPKAVTVIAGPVIFYVDPPYVYDAITTPVTVYTTGGITSLTSVTLTPHGQAAPVVDVTAASAIDANHPAHVIINVPGNPTLADGSYDLTIVNQGDCPAFYPNAITVKPMSGVALDIAPHFGSSTDTTAVTITAATSFFQGGARAYLAPENQTPPRAIPLSSVVFHDPKMLTAIVPSGLTVGPYDLVVVNPDGSIGFLGKSGSNVPFTVVGGAVPTIDPNSPGSVAQSCTAAACDLPLAGTNFNSTAVVSATCTLGANTMTFSAIQLAGSTATAIPLNLSGPAGMGADTTCTFHLVETVAGVAVSVDGGRLVVRNASSNLDAATTTASQTLKTPRRGHGMAFTGPTASARYLYVYGGDNGSTTTVGATLYDSVELATVDPQKGDTTSAFYQMPNAELASSTQAQLPSARTFVGAASIGRFVYAIGGMTSTSAATTDILRAESLDPAESPLVSDADLTPVAPESTGVSSGLYFYRVSALMSAGDDLNPAGETLASDELAINVPAFGTNKIQVSLYWKKGPALGARTVAKWRVYRTTNPNAAPGSEDQYADVPDPGTSVIQIIDVGNGIELPAANPTVVAWTTQKKPLPFGALGNWAAAHVYGVATPTTKLTAARGAPAVAHVVEPATGGGTVDVLYVAYGSTNGTTLLNTYDLVTVSGAATGQPSEAAAVTATVGTSSARWLAGGYGVMDTASPEVWFGPGNGTNANDFQHCTIAPTTLLLTCAGVGNVNLWAYGAVNAVGELFAFGGASSQMPNGLTNQIGSAPESGTFNFTPQGGGTLQSPLGTNYPLAYNAAVLGGAYFWIAGGVTNAGGLFAVSNKVLFDLY